MMTYLLESGLSLLVLLGTYHLLLEDQPMHRLKRTYLLGTLVVSLAAPLLTVEVPPEALPTLSNAPAPLTTRVLLAPATAATMVNAIPTNSLRAAFYFRSFILLLFATGTLLLLVRFGRNLSLLITQVRRHTTQLHQGATLVLLPDDTLPHTFLHYLFISKVAFERGEIEPELLTHELTHIRQRHSLDVLLIELVLCFGWFNPLLFWLKRAMQRNHEFLADEAVNATHGNICGYQRLLLSALTHTRPTPALASTLTFQTTKQRLLMMTRHASSARTWLAAGSAALLFGSLTFLLTAQLTARQTPAQPAAQPAPPANGQLTIGEMERRFGNKQVRGAVKEIKTVVTFNDLTPEQKSRVVVLRPNARKTPTEAEWTAFHNPKKYGIWIDEKRRRQNPLATYKRTDIVSFWSSYVHKNARQPEGYTNQLELYTEAGYQKMLTEWEEKPWLHLVSKEQFEKRQKAMVRQ